MPHYTEASVRGPKADDLDTKETEKMKMGGSAGKTDVDTKFTSTVIAAFSDFAAAFKGLFTDNKFLEQISGLASIDGMTGDKYRALILSKILEYGTNKKMSPEEIYILTLMIAGTYGVAKQKKRLDTYLATVTNMHPMVSHLKTWSDTYCRTYVNDGDPTVKNKSIPTVKIPDSLPDYALLGMILFKLDYFENTYGATPPAQIKDFASFPDYLKRQFIGNFKLHEDFQNDHEKWEFDLWEKRIMKTNNSNTAAYEPGYHRAYYANRRGDIFRLRKLNGVYVNYPKDGYTYDDFDKYMKALVVDTMNAKK